MNEQAININLHPVAAEIAGPVTKAPKSSEGRANLRERQKAATRESILEAALVVLSEVGYDGLTIAKVAREAGVANGLINYHFDGKDHLIEQAEARILDQVLQRIKGSLATSESPRETIDVLNQVWDAIGEADTLLPAFFALLSKAVSEPQYRPRFLAHLKQHREIIEQTLEMVAGPMMSAANIPTRPAATVLVALTAGLAMLRFIDPKSSDAVEALEQFKQLVLDAIIHRAA